MSDNKLTKIVGALAGAAIAAGGIVLAAGIGADVSAAADPVKNIPLAAKRALAAAPDAEAIAADAALAAQADRDARAAFEAADAALFAPGAPAAGTAEHDALLAARFAARADWAAAGVAANDAAQALQDATEARRGAEVDFDRAVCGATVAPNAKVAAYCAKIAPPVESPAP